MKENILENIIFLVRKKIYEETPTNSLSGGNIAGTKEAGDDPPVDFRKNKYKRVPTPYKALIKRKKLF